MNFNTQNAKIASITEKTLIVGIDVGSDTRGIMNIRRSHWNSVILRRVSRCSKHGLKISQKNKVKQL